MLFSYFSHPKFEKCKIKMKKPVHIDALVWMKLFLESLFNIAKRQYKLAAAADKLLGKLISATPCS